MDSQEAMARAESVPHSFFGSQTIETKQCPESIAMSSPTTADCELQSVVGQKLRTMGRWDTVLVLMTNQVGLGVLSLPSVLETLGIVPGALVIISIGCLSWYTAHELKQFYLRHSSLVLHAVDMARIVGGRGYAFVTGLGLLVMAIMTAVSVSVVLSIAFGVISGNHDNILCFTSIGCLCCWVLCIPRTAKFVSRSGLPCCVSIVAATLMIIIDLGVERPNGASKEWKRKLVVFGSPTFRQGLNACLKVCYAYSGNVNFVSYMSEMVDPARDFDFALAWLEVVSIAFYTIAAITIYVLAGQYTVSPALGSASPHLARAAYIVVLPSVLSKGLAFGHTGAKFVFVEVVRYYRIPDEAPRTWLIWVTIVTLFWVLCFTLSIVIPVFDSVLSLTSAVTICWFTFGFSAIFWFHSHWRSVRIGGRKAVLACVNISLLGISLFLSGAGLWSSTTELVDVVVHNGHD